MRTLRLSLLASLALLPLLATEAVAATAGVTAAVNQNARSTPPGGAIRTIVLGDNVVQDETIETDGNGLVQILLADGTTFTVGPNSTITIDRFVYDPAADTAQVSASIGRGVFRFIGGRTSKTEGGVQLNTPVGTVGIRGGMADLNFTGSGGNAAQIDLLFGKEITLKSPRGSERLYQAGYSFIFGANGLPSVVKTPPGSASFIQQALAGRPGTSGGNKQKPSDGQVASSGIAQTNSANAPAQPPQMPQPDLRAIELATPKPDNHQIAEGIAPGGPKTRSGQYGGYAAAAVIRGTAATEFYRNILPDDVDFTFNPETGSFSGRIGVRVDPNSPHSLEVAFGPEHGGESVYYNDLVYYGTGPSSAITLDGNAVGNGGIGTQVVSLEIGSALSDCNCSFIQMGYWLSAFDASSEAVEAMGTFVVGDITTDDEYENMIMPTYGSASYSGIALGFLDQGGVTEAAAGSLYMEYDLDQRQGWMDISNFGSAGVGFTGQLEGTGASYSGTGTDGGTSYQVDGSFVSDGSNPTAGVIGNFAASNGNWSAGGVFGGAYTGQVTGSP